MSIVGSFEQVQKTLSAPWGRIVGWKLVGDIYLEYIHFFVSLQTKGGWGDDNKPYRKDKMMQMMWMMMMMASDVEYRRG